MYMNFSTEVELSVLFEADAITIYEGDSMEPEQSFQILDLVDELLDAICDENAKIYEDEKDEAEPLLETLKKAQDAIEAAL